MLGVDEARALALGLPEAVERDHHGFPSFRVRDRIFATLPDEATLRVMLDQDAAEEAVAASGGCCSILRWGARVAGVAITLAAADRALVAELLTDAWRRRAPAKLTSPPPGGETGS